MFYGDDFKKFLSYWFIPTVWMNMMHCFIFSTSKGNKSQNNWWTTRE